MSKIISASKRSLAILMSLCLVAALMVCPGVALAAETKTVEKLTPDVPGAVSPASFIMDDNDTIEASAQADLESQVKEVSASTGIGIYLLFVDDIGTSSARSFAEKQYINRHLGLGTDTSGVMFLVATQSRDYVTVTHGMGINAFTDDYIDDMEDDIVSYLKNNNWLDASKAYVADAKRAAEYYAEHGEPYKEPLNIPMTILISLVVGAVVAFLVCKSKASAHKTAVEATEADAYVDEGSFELTQANDLYRNTTVICIKRHDDDKRGGSTVSSSGFGGSSGGKF